MRIAIYQCRPHPDDVTGNLSRLHRAAADAARDGAHLLICPEMFLSGYNIGLDAVRRLAEPRDGPSASAVASIAREQRIAIAYGYPERAADNAIYDAAQVIGSAGSTLGHYRKTHLFGDLDRSMFSPSTAEAPLIEFNRWHLGLLICYDVEFPENARRLALSGADLIIVPTANMIPYEFIANTIVPARAFENQLYVGYANYCGSEGQIEYCGLSCIASPDGADATRAGHDEQLIAADLDHDRMTNSRRINTYLADRVPALYRSLTSEPAV
jgi:predicted amidohydrolase